MLFNVANESVIIEWTVIFEIILTTFGVIFLIYSLYLINKIKQLFPGTKISKKWMIMQLLIVLFIVIFILDIVFVFYHIHDLINIMNGILHLSAALFVLVIITLIYKTYQLVLLQNKK